LKKPETVGYKTHTSPFVNETKSYFGKSYPQGYPQAFHSRITIYFCSKAQHYSSPKDFFVAFANIQRILIEVLFLKENIPYKK
jgi:hypothetical protein